MGNLPVHWSEGLFLRPHHFQASDRYWTETVQRCQQWDHPCNYGIRALEVSPEAIANYQFQVNLCHARMKDGTLVALDPGQELDRVDLKEALAEKSEIRAYLAVPKLKMGAVNVAAGPGANNARYAESRQSVQDESRGGNDQEVEFRGLNVRVLLSTQDMAGYEVLPLCQIQRSGEEQAAPRLDDTYFPPMLAIDAWPPLGRDVVRAIYDLIGRKIEVLSAQSASREMAPSGLEPGDLERLWMLSELNQAYCVLGVLSFAPGVHPLTAYIELCRIVGQLCFFRPDRRTPEIPRYDHDDLAKIFRYIKEQILLLLEMIQLPNYVKRDFVGEGLGMRVKLEAEWLASDWQWFVGVHRENITERECLALLQRGALDWKLGSTRQVDDLFRTGKEGLHLEPLPQAPRALPPWRDWLYFEVSRGNAAWRDVLETQTLAMRLRDTLIVNLSELQGKPRIVVSIGGRQVGLQFALFAVSTPRSRP